jgi:hypothetical protein
MPEAPDLKALAERYLDLWEEQFAAAAADPALAAAVAAWLGPWRALAGGATPAAPGEAVRKGQDAGKTKRESREAPARSAAAAAAPGGGGGGLDDLLERIGRIERRLDALERKRRGKGGRARAGPRGGRARRAG